MNILNWTYTVFLAVATVNCYYGSMEMFSFEQPSSCFDFSNRTEFILYLHLRAGNVDTVYYLIENAPQQEISVNATGNRLRDPKTRHFMNFQENFDFSVTMRPDGQYDMTATRQEYAPIASQGVITVYEASSDFQMREGYCTYFITTQWDVPQILHYDQEPDVKPEYQPMTSSPTAVSTNEIYIELFIVHDYAMYTLFNKSVQTLSDRTAELVNALDTIYRAYRIRVQLTGMEVWTDGDKFNITADYNNVLEQFSLYTTDSKFDSADHVHLLTGFTKFDYDVVGLAYVSYMCSKQYSTGFTVASPDRLIQDTVATLAHELAHTLGINHDDTSCSCHDTCFMHAYVHDPAPKYFSNCSVENLVDFLDSFKATCLRNKPTQNSSLASVSVLSKCGNNIIDEGEECDCGGEYFCTNPCCDPKTCRFTEASECFDGACCRQCKIEPANTLCRDAGDLQCDLTDFCDGNSSTCPDVYKENGIRCAEGGGLCYDGVCESRDQQCQAFWGSGAKNAHDVCYEDVNKLGLWYGHCTGTNDTQYTPCSAEDVMCGTLHCVDKPDTYPAIGWSKSYGVLSVSMSNGYQKCQVGSSVMGRSQPNPGMVSDWTPCGTDKYCLDQRCVSFAFQTACVQTCGNGFCTNRGECYCDKEAGVNCSTPITIQQESENTTAPTTTTTTTTTTNMTTNMTTTVTFLATQKPGLFDNATNSTTNGGEILTVAISWFMCFIILIVTITAFVL